MNAQKKILPGFFGLAFLVLFAYAFPKGVQGQKIEFGGFFGGSYYIGDLNPHKHFPLTRISGGGVLRYNIDQHFSVRLNGIFATLEGSDAIVGYNTNRNLSFITSILELSAQLEVNFLPFITGNLITPISPYLFVGPGAFAYVPQAFNDIGELITLRNLGTEGQWYDPSGFPRPYSLITGNLLLGVGFKFNISKDITGGLEYGIRFTGTDYIDDVSGNYADPFSLSGDARFFSDRSLTNRFQNTGHLRGDPTTKDNYSFFGFLLTVKLRTTRDFLCPAYF